MCPEFHDKVIAPWILLLILFSLLEVLVCRSNVSFLPSVLQFVPRNIDVGFCNFSRRIEKGLTMAFMEVSKHQEFYNFTVQVRLACFVSVPFSPHLWLSVFCPASKTSWVLTGYHLPSRSCRTIRLVVKSGFFSPTK